MRGAYVLLACSVACTRGTGPAPKADPPNLLTGAVEDFLQVTLPPDAHLQPQPGPPRAGCEASQSWTFSAGGQDYRLVEARLGRTAPADRFSLQIKQVILAAEDQLSAAHPKFTKLDLATPDMQGVLAAGTLLIEGEKGWLLDGIAYLRHPGGELFSLELFQRGQVDGGVPSIALLESIASGAKPGPKAPSVGPGRYRLPALQLELPADFMLECNAGPDFDLYNVRRIQPLAEAAGGHLFFYVGGFPQEQRPADHKDYPDWARSVREKGELLGHPISWRWLQADGVIQSVHLGAQVEVRPGEKVDLRVVCQAAEECAALLGIAESLASSGPR